MFSQLKKWAKKPPGFYLIFELRKHFSLKFNFFHSFKVGTRDQKVLESSVSKVFGVTESNKLGMSPSLGSCLQEENMSLVSMSARLLLIRCWTSCEPCIYGVQAIIIHVSETSFLQFSRLVIDGIMECKWFTTHWGTWWWVFATMKHGPEMNTPHKNMLHETARCRVPISW